METNERLMRGHPPHPYRPWVGVLHHLHGIRSRRLCIGHCHFCRNRLRRLQLHYISLNK
jgi:hypothetical protein